MKFPPVLLRSDYISSKGGMGYLLVSELLFGNRRDFEDIIERLDISRFQPNLIKPLLIKLRGFVASLYLPL